MEQAAADRNNVLPDEVRPFLEQYATTVRGEIVSESSEVQKLARKIYLKNREVVDLLKVILEFDVPSYRTGVAQKRNQEQEVNRQE